MKFFAAVATVAAAFQAEPALFEKFVADFGKVYKTEEARDAAKATFSRNVAKIIAHNLENKDYTMEINEFADMSAEEFSSARLGLKMPKSGFFGNVPKVGTHVYSGAALPDSVDWTAKGAVTPVKNQGQCGSCWSFSTTGGLEGANFLASGKLVSFSEQQFVDCDTVDQGCNGGLMDNAFKFAEANDLCTEESYPYKAVGGSCAASSCTVGLKQGDVTGFTDVDHTENALMEAIAKQPVSIAIEADQQAFQFYSGGVMTGDCGQQLDHGVLAVGYGTLDGKNYWKVKNSWGASWGMSGYILIERGSNKCGILNSASYPQVAKQAELQI
jgi:C1A family cysteine protease